MKDDTMLTAKQCLEHAEGCRKKGQMYYKIACYFRYFGMVLCPFNFCLGFLSFYTNSQITISGVISLFFGVLIGVIAWEYPRSAKENITTWEELAKRWEECSRHSKTYEDTLSQRASF
jgi:hypothetical protein